MQTVIFRPTVAGSTLYEIDVHYYLTYFLALHHHCFDEQQARDIANGDQGTDDDPQTSPGPGWYSYWTDPSRFYLPAGILSVFDSRMNNERQQTVNAYYHALHPGAAKGVGSPQLWQAATEGCGNLKTFGQYMHYLQDTFSHEGYDSPKCGHGCKGQHLPDHTRSDVRKTLDMAKATWKALNEFAKLEHCNCQADWNLAWDQQITNFAEIGYPTEAARRAYEGDDWNLDIKRMILQVPMRLPGILRTAPAAP